MNRGVSSWNISVCFDYNIKSIVTDAEPMLGRRRRATSTQRLWLAIPAIITVSLRVLKYATRCVFEVTRYVINVTRNLNYVTRFLS